MSMTLNDLIMDGLYTSPACRQLIFTDSSASKTSPYTLKSNLFSKLDPCVLMMDNLRTLHLSGNGLTGSLPNILYISSNLTDLSLSHNLLTGVVADSFQMKRWQRLDLSFNKISGTLSSSGFSNVNVDSIVYLEENLLSGDIPHGLIGLQEVNIFNGNIFGCSVSKSDAPRNDPSYSNYSCGSNSFNVVYFIWLGLIGSLVVLILILRYVNLIGNKGWSHIYRIVISDIKDMLSNLRNTQFICKSLDRLNVELMKAGLENILEVFFRVMFYIITILLTIYAINGSLNGLYTYQYGWTVSIAFQSGEVAFGLAFSGLFVLSWLLIMLFSNQKSFRTAHTIDIYSNFESKLGMSKVCSNLLQEVIYFFRNIFSHTWIIAPLINVFVVGGINILYVYLYLHQSNIVIVFLQILLAIFKSFWNGLGYRYLSRLVNYWLRVDNLSLRHTSMQLFIRLVNNIIIPCIVVAIINPECFYNLIVAAPAVVTNFEFQYCAEVNLANNICSQNANQIQTTTFDPPYYYSYQCSSRFITYDAPTFVFLCLIDGLIVPLLQLVCCKLYEYGINNTINDNKDWLKYLSKVTPRILKLNQLDEIHVKAERDKLHPLFDSLQLYLDNLTYLGL